MKKLGFLLCLSLILSGCNNSKKEYEDGIYTLGNSFEADIFLHDKTAEDKHVTVVKEKGKYYDRSITI